MIILATRSFIVARRIGPDLVSLHVPSGLRQPSTRFATMGTFDVAVALK